MAAKEEIRGDKDEGRGGVGKGGRRIKKKKKKKKKTGMEQVILLCLVTLAMPFRIVLHR